MSLYFIQNPLKFLNGTLIQSDVYFRLCGCVEKILKQRQKDQLYSLCNN